MNDFPRASTSDTEEDELASSGMHVVGDTDADQADDADENTLSVPKPIDPDEEDETTDGLARLEAMEKTLDEPPIDLGEDE